MSPAACEERRPSISNGAAQAYYRQIRVRPFSKFFGHDPVPIDHSELSAMVPSFSKLNNVYLSPLPLSDSR